MKLSMIVVITSCAPNFALSAPGIPPTIPPPIAAAMRYTGSVTSAGSPAGSSEPNQRGDESARGELTLGADVEQPGAQPDRDRESGERQRRRLVENLAEVRRRCPTCLRAAGDRPCPGFWPNDRMSMSPTIAATSSATIGGKNRLFECWRRACDLPAARLAARPWQPDSSSSCGVLAAAPVMNGPRTSSLASTRGNTWRRACRHTSPRCDRTARESRRGRPRRAGWPCRRRARREAARE